MTAEAIVAVSAAVVALTQLIKWGGLPDRYGPLAVLILSVVGALFYGWSHGQLVSRELAYEYFVGSVAVATSAAGVFGFTRASSEAVTRVTAPPIGAAGGNPTSPPLRRVSD